MAHFYCLYLGLRSELDDDLVFRKVRHHNQSTVSRLVADNIWPLHLVSHHSRDLSILTRYTLIAMRDKVELTVSAADLLITEVFCIENERVTLEFASVVFWANIRVRIGL